jgi:CheY-like chemotaxis protein
MTLVKVLLVDDSAEFASVFARVLQSGSNAPPVAVHVAHDLAEARAAPWPFHCAIVDRHLPDGDGTTLVRAVRASCRDRATPMLVITGEPVDAITIECALMGAAAVSKRPPELLKEYARRFVRDAGGRPGSLGDALRRVAVQLAAEARLPSALAAVLIAHAEDLSQEEIAEMRRVSTATIKTQTARIREALAAIDVDCSGSLRVTLLEQALEQAHDL